MTVVYKRGIINPNRIAFDVDGVFADTVNTFIEVAAGRYGVTHIKQEHITSFDLSMCLDLEPDLIKMIICDALDDENTMKTRPIPYAAEVLTKISNYAPLIFVTARVWGESIKRWVSKQLPKVNDERIRIYATGNPNKKLDILKKEGVEYFVEDRLETCLVLHEAGIKPIVFEQPWNRERHNFLKVRSWLELQDLIDWNSHSGG